MADKKYLGINTNFSSLKIPNFAEFNIRTPVSILDYDVVIINTLWIFYPYSSVEKYKNLRLLNENDSVQVLSDLQRIKSELIEFLNSGRNVYVILSRSEDCYIYTGKKEYSGTGKNSRCTNIVDVLKCMSFLPVDVNLEYVSGSNITCDCQYPYKDFFVQQRENLYYSAYLKKDTGLHLAKISKSNRAVSAVVEYGNGKIIFLPDTPGEDEYPKRSEWIKNGKSYINSIIELDVKLTEGDGKIVLPNWVEKYCVPGEVEIENKINKAKIKLEKLTKELELAELDIEKNRRIKLLLSGTGKELEGITKEILEKIGFKIFPSNDGREDIRAEYKGTPIVIEVKGLIKSAAEKNVAQLEKWASLYLEETGKIAKAILIVNAYRDLPLESRTEEVFPNQMLKYAVCRGHCLMTTTQLLCLYIDLANNKANAAKIINDLLSTNGIYGNYSDYINYLGRK